MSCRMLLTLKKRPPEHLCKTIQEFYEDTPKDLAPGWKVYFDTWSLPAITKALEAGVEAAKRELDSTAKGWKPTDEGKNIHYGVQGHGADLEFWYQRQYTK